MKQLIIFGDATSQDVWLRACTYMGTGWTWVPGKQTFMHGPTDSRVTLCVIRDVHDQAKLYATGERFDMIVEHASFNIHGKEWDAYVSSRLLNKKA
jgi:hypothetical protein